MEGIETWAEVYKRLKVTKIAKDFDDLFATPRKSSKSPYQISDFPQPPDVEPIVGVRYLADRGLGQEIVDAFGLLYGVRGEYSGIHIDNSIIVPIWDLNGSYITFQTRNLHPSGLRWKSPAGSPLQNLLYGGWLVSERTGQLWIVEGASDVWNFHKYGIQAVGIFTKEASAAQINRIRELCLDFGLQPIVCLDGDAVLREPPFRDFGKKIFDELCAFGLEPHLVHLSAHEDPGNLSADRVREVLSGVRRSEGQGDAAQSSYRGNVDFPGEDET